SRMLAVDGFRLARFAGAGGGFRSYAYDWPWWIEHYDYWIMISSEAGELFDGFTWVQTPFFGLISSRVNYLVSPLTVKLSSKGEELSSEEIIRRLQLLRPLSSLRYLDLGYSSINDTELESIEAWDNLETLIIDSTKISDQGLSHLNQLTHLKKLNLYETLTTPESRDTLRASLPNCEISPKP
ncbi:MAG TPA: hypothetical protein VGM98_02535, partial [Schlesneria sp.]